MTLYLFYPRDHDGACETFIAADLAGDGAARIHALRVLDAHPPATQVGIWDGDRSVGVLARGRDRTGGPPRTGGVLPKGAHLRLVS